MIKRYKKQNVDFDNIVRFFNSAQKKFRSAKKIIRLDEESAYKVAYEAMLQASLALMLSYGTRPRSLPGHHVAIIEFSARKIGKEYTRLIDTFDKMRRKRNQSVYEADIEITASEARNALVAAEKYLKIIRQHINKNNPQLRLKF